jgi:hypothetical protein
LRIDDREFSAPRPAFTPVVGRVSSAAGEKHRMTVVLAIDDLVYVGRYLSKATYGPYVLNTALE